jgi:exodeoxyribonuclease VII small subunit
MAKRSRKAADAAAGSESAQSGSDSEPGPEAPNFESSLEKLETIVDRLEAGDLPLEGALKAFEQGVGLMRRCAEQLETAERRIEVLVREGESWVTRPFDATEESE